MGLSLHNIGRKIENLGGAVFHGLDPVDNGQGWTNTPTPNQPQRSVVQQITRNPVVTTVARSAQFIPQFAEDYSNIFANVGNRLAGAPNQTIQQNMGGNRFLDKTLKLSGATGKDSQLAGDVAQIGLSAAVPLAGKIAEPLAAGTVGAFAPKVAPKLVYGLSRGLGSSAERLAPVGSKAIATGTAALGTGLINAGFGASQASGAGGTPKQILKATGQGFGTGLALGTGGELVAPLAVAGVKVAAKGAKNLPKVALKVQQYDQAQNQVGAIGKNVNKPSPALPKVSAKTPPQGVKVATKAGQGSTPPDFLATDKGYNPKPQTPMTAEDLANLSPQEQMARAAQDPNQTTFNGPSLKSKSQQTVNKFTSTAETPKSAIAENTYLMGERSRRYNNALDVGSKLSEADKSKLSDATNGLDVGKVDNPQLFNKTVSSLKDAHDFSLMTDRLGGGQTVRFNKGNFSPLYFKASTEALDRLGVPADQRFNLSDGTTSYVQAGEDSALTAGKYHGYHNIQRKYGSYTEAADKTQGILQPLNKNALEDARMYANRGHSVIEGNLLRKQLSRLFPGEVSQDLNTKFKGDTKLVHAANGNLPFNVSERLNKELAGYKSNRISNPIGEAAFKSVELPSKALRKVAFLAAPIHYVNLTRSFLSTTIPSGHGITGIKGIGEALGASLHPKVYSALQDAANTVKPGQEFSPRDFAGKLGITDRDTRPNLLGKGLGKKGTVEKFSPFALQMRNMNRFNNVLGWKLAERVQELGVKPGTADAQAIGTEINKVIDRINPKMEGLNPIGERLATSGSLAPHWIRANIGLVKDALKTSIPNFGNDTLKARNFGAGKTGLGLQNAGDIARTNVLGGRVLVGGVAVLASALATGQMPTLQRVINEAGFNPNNPTPNVDTKSQTKAKYPGQQRYGQVLNLPTDPIGMAVGLVTDPKHFFIARETPALSAATQAVANQDFFGNPIVDKSQPGWQEKLAAASAKKLLPFGVQNATNPSLTPGQIVEAAFGARTKTNPNDPNHIQTQNFFTGVTDAKKGLGSNGIRAVDEYYGSKKDPITGAYQTPSVWDTIAKAVELNKNPDALTNLQTMNLQLATKGGKIDPLWNESLDHLKSYFQYQANPDPNSPQRSVWYDKNKSWYQPLSDARGKFFDSLPKGDPNKPAQPVEYPNPSPSVAKLQDQYYAFTNPADASKFIRANPDLQAQFDKEFKYKNDLLTARGYAPYKDYPKATPQLQNFIDQYTAADKGTRKGIRNSNPQLYQNMVAYFDSTDLYGIGKQEAKSQLQGQPDYTSAEAKKIQSLASDIYQNSDGSYSIVPAGWMNGLGGGGGYGGYGGGRSKTTPNPLKYAISINAGGKPKVSAPKTRKAQGLKFGKVTARGGKPKVSSRKSLV